MKKVLTLFLMIALTMTVMAQKPRVAVYVSGDDPINELVGSSLEDGLAHNGKYTAVERTASFLSALSKEHEFQRSGEVDDDQIAELGKQFSVQYVCVASVSTVWGNEKYISARIIDVESAEVLASGCSNGATNTTDQLVRALDGLSESLLNALDYSKKAGAKKVAVYVTKSGNRDVDIILGDQLVAGFAKSGKYLAIERTSRFLSELSKEQGYQQSGAVADEDLVRLGQKAGVQYVCVAKTSKFNDDYFISSRLIDVVHGDIVNSSYEKGKKLNNSNNVISVAADIATKLSGRTIEEEAEWQKAEKKRLEKERQEREKIEERERIRMASKKGMTIVALFDVFDENYGLDDKTKEYIREKIGSILNKNSYYIVKRSMLNKAINEQLMQLDHRSVYLACEIGEKVGANKVVIPLVSLVGGRALGSIKIIDVTTKNIEKQQIRVAVDVLDCMSTIALDLWGN